MFSLIREIVQKRENRGELKREEVAKFRSI
jgi:hypothetical protein